MDDLISRKAAMDCCFKPQVRPNAEIFNALKMAIRSEISVLQSVDAAPVKHGRWEGDETCDAYDVAGVKTWAVKRKCSSCGFVHKFIEAHMCYEFCPNCGAKMDLEQ